VLRIGEVVRMPRDAPRPCATLPFVLHLDRYRVGIGSQTVDLPLVPIGPDTAISLLMTIDWGVAFMARAGAELADLLRGDSPEMVASAATLGIPVAIEVSRALGLDDYLILQKTPKIHLADALAEPLSSITTGQPQQLLLDRARVPAVKGKRVVLVDDVVATGGSMAASLRLLRAAGADVVAIGTLLAEGAGWRAQLGTDSELVRYLGVIPGFRRAPGGWEDVWE
jgi:adenine/guanine phosphoribosyltransferase-like PRPP-binding protein